MRCNSSSDLETCAVFEIDESQCPPLEPGKPPRPFRDPAGVVILQRIADSLATRGYVVSTVKPAFGIEAGFSCQLGEGFDLQVSLGVSTRRNGFVECDLITYHSPSLLKRIFLRDATCHGEWVAAWRQFCTAINERLVQDLGAVSVAWTTEQAASTRWKAQE